MSIITYPLDGVTYSAEDVATYLCTRTSGVYAKDSNFAVSITGTRQITIAPGLAWINYDDFKGVSVCSREDTVLTVPDADNTLNRVDRVVLQFDTSSNLTAIRLKTGTPAVAAQPPDILQNHNQYELGLCTISVPAGSAAVTSADITDTRTDEAVCGLMRDGVTGIPTETLLAQYTAILTAMQQSGNAQLQQLAESIKAVDSGSFYTKEQADAKFGTPYSLPPATADQLGGVKVGRGLTVSADGTLEMTAENLDTVLGFSLAEKLNQLRGVTDMNGKLVYTSDGAAGKSNKTMTVPDEVDYIVVRMAVPLECTTIATTGGVAAAAAADYGCTRIVRGGTAVAIVGGGNTYNLRDGVYCKGEALVKVSFAANGTVNIGVVDVNLASNDNAYPFNVEGYQYV